MSSFEQKYYLTNPTVIQGIKRDVALLIESALFLLIWLVKGRKIRRAYQQAQEENSTLILEDYLGK